MIVLYKYPVAIFTYLDDWKCPTFLGSIQIREDHASFNWIKKQILLFPFFYPSFWLNAKLFEINSLKIVLTEHLLSGEEYIFKIQIWNRWVFFKYTQFLITHNFFTSFDKEKYLRSKQNKHDEVECQFGAAAHTFHNLGHSKSGFDWLQEQVLGFVGFVILLAENSKKLYLIRGQA